MELQYSVEVIHNETDEIVKIVDCGTSSRKAEKISNALNANLNHNEYTVYINIKAA